MYNEDMLKISRVSIILAVFGLLALSRESIHAQTSDAEYFAETGHFVEGSFLQFYLSASNPTVVFGYPLTEQFTSKDGKIVQYFQRARFEKAGDWVVQTPIGRETYSQDRQLTINNPLACREFSATGYSVCFAFLGFFDQNGGVARFGNPISPFEFHNDQIVQYFENARFEWRPSQPEGLRIGLTDLGRIYFDHIGEDPGFLKPRPRGFEGSDPVLSLRVWAFPTKAVTTRSDQQTIYILLQDQNLQPVSGATGIATIRLPSGNSTQQVFEITKNGIGILQFAFQNQPNGQLVNIDISVSYNDLRGKTTSSFRIWY